jgi:hypothetical protein
MEIAYKELDIETEKRTSVYNDKGKAKGKVSLSMQ